MSGLLASLGSSVNAMRAHSAALDVAGRNLANVNNPAYARQRVIYGSSGTVRTSLGPQSMGLEAVGIRQFRDRLIDVQLVREQFNASSLEGQSEIYHQILASLESGVFQDSAAVDSITGNRTVPKGLSDLLDAFFNSWQSFAAQPINPVEKQYLVDRTDALLNRMHLMDERLASVALEGPATSNGLTLRLDDEIGEVNRLLGRVAELNRQIGGLEIARPGTAIDARDQRQAVIEELAQYLNFTAAEQTDGQITLSLSDSTGGTVDLVSQAEVQGTLGRNGADFEWSPVAGGTLTLDVTGGRLHGEVQAGLAAQGLRDDLDSFVASLVEQVNTAYHANLNGNFFDPAGNTAGTIARAATVATLRAGDLGNPSGDNTNALAVAALVENTGFHQGATPALALTRLITGFSQQVNDVDSRLEDSQLLQRAFLSQRESYSGVSVDEEAADLVRYQRALEASARVFQVVDNLLDKIINDMAR